MSQTEALEKYRQKLEKEKSKCEQEVAKANRALNRVEAKLIDCERSFRIAQKRGNKAVLALLGHDSSSLMPKTLKKQNLSVPKVEEKPVSAPPVDAGLNEKEKKTSWFNPFND